MSETSFLKLSFLSPQFTSSCTPNRLCPGHRHCLSVLDFLLLLLLHEVKKGIRKTGKIETAKNFIFFVNRDFFLDKFFSGKGEFQWLLFKATYFRRDRCSSLTKINLNFNSMFLHTSEEKNIYFFLIDAGETTFLWLLLSLMVVTWWMYVVFCQLMWLTFFIWPDIQNQTLACNCCFTNNIVSETKQLLLLLYLNSCHVPYIPFLFHFLLQLILGFQLLSLS